MRLCNPLRLCEKQCFRLRYDLTALAVYTSTRLHLQTTTTTGGQKLVAIGGGTGLSTLLAGLKRLVGKTDEEIWIESLSAIVTVSDDGGSSGRLRDELQMLPPGDIRNCMIALSEDSGLLSRLFRYRFRGDGELGGHSFGNLFLAALTEVTGDFTEAIRLVFRSAGEQGPHLPGNDQRHTVGCGTRRWNSRAR